MHEDNDDDLLAAYRAAYRQANGGDPPMRHEGGRFLLLIRATGVEKAFTRAELVDMTEMLRARFPEAVDG